MKIIFAASNTYIPMPNKNDQTDEAHSDNSEIADDGVKYIKMLKLQRSILNKLIETNFNQAPINNNTDPDDPDIVNY
jgi:hypothetical protein